MSLNGIDNNTPGKEPFRNALQHELAAAAFQKLTGSPTIGVDGVGVGQEFYQAGKDAGMIVSGVAQSEIGKLTKDPGKIKHGQDDLMDGRNRLASMFPSDTLVDIANNHKGAELASTTTHWNDLLGKLIKSAAQAPDHNGLGQ
jgi:hypothetical protein